MTQAEKDLLALINRRVARLQPEVARAMRAVFQLLADEIGASQVVDLIKSGRINDIISEETLEVATRPLRAQIRDTVADGYRLTLPDIPRAIVAGKPQIFFDVLNPRIQDALRSMDNAAIDTIRIQSRAVVREVVEAGLLRGEHPTAIARELRQAIGMAPHQERWVQNFASELRAGDINTLKRKLLTDRTSQTLLKVFQSGKAPTEKQIQAAVAEYRKRTIAMNASVNTRQLTLDSYRTARKEAYMSAVERGIIPADAAVKTWVHFDGQKNPRPEHVALNGLTIPIDQEWPNGEGMIAGVTKFNCRCSERYSVRRPSRVVA